jgi:peptide/nickel transport system substrate-binding protein
MTRDKKYYLIIVLSFLLVASGIGNIYFAFDPEIQITPPPSRTLNVGTNSGPYRLDPIHSMDKMSNDVIEQVCEGLYAYNLSDPNLGIIPRLALDFGTWDSSGTHFTVPLRRDILFHDRTPFNAEAVKWNFERINWFMNGTGTLNTTLSDSHLLWEFPNGTTILDPINPITIYNEYTVILNLRAPFAIIEPLLCYVNAFMLSPESTPKYEYISTNYGYIVGTGPFVYDYYISDTQVNFHRWDDYWREPAFFEELNFNIINDATKRYEAIKDHTIDYLIGNPPSFISSDYSDPTLKFSSDLPSLSYFYLGMNNKKINTTWRNAISYAINYTYIIEELKAGSVYRSNGPLAPNYPMYNPSIQAATYNLTKARELVLSMGLGNMSWSDAQWQAAEFQSWNYSYNIGNDFREDLLILLQDNLNQIGITVIDQGMTWADFLCWVRRNPITLTFDELELYWIGFAPSFLSPYNIIFPLFSNLSISNSAMYHQHTTEMLLQEVLSQTNANLRELIYSNILHQIVEVDMPHAFGYHPYQQIVHSADIHGVSYNAMGSFYAYPMYRA